MHNQTYLNLTMCSIGNRQTKSDKSRLFASV